MKLLNINLSNILALLLIFVLTSSCDDELSISPTDVIDRSSAFQNIDDIDDGALGAYGTISGENIYSINSLISDHLRRAQTNTGQGIQLFNHVYTAGDGDAAGWTNTYDVIDRINRVLQAIPDIEPDNQQEEDLLTRIEGEMLALRAHQHFNLFRSYANYDLNGDDLAAPYLLEPQAPESEPARDTKAEFFSKLQDDIDNGLAILEPFGLFSTQRMNIRALEAFQARVALYRENFQVAADFASRVINEVSLTSRNDYPNLWNDSMDGEILLKLPRQTPNDGTVDIFERTGNDDIFWFASNELVDLYEPDDVRFQIFFDSSDPAAVRVQKYNQRSAKNLADIKLLRVSEMYLIRAEALAQPGPQQDLGAAQTDLETLRNQRIDNPDGINFTDSDTAIELIQKERRLELAYEGHRWFDLKRANLPVDRIPADIDGVTSSDFLAEDNFRMLFPIPQDEVFANDNINQNPGY